MDKSKIKDLVIIILLIVNAFFLILVVSNRSDAGRAESFRIETMRQVFYEKGIVIADNVELSKNLPKAILQSRNLKSEHKMISSLLANTNVEDKGGNIMFYSGALGTANFRGTGDFEILLSSNNEAYLNDPVAAAKTILKRLGLSRSGDEPILDTSGSSPVVTLTCAHKGASIFNTRIRFAFISDNDVLISGRRPLDDSSTLSVTAECSDAVTALMRFLEHINKSGQICSEIKAVEVGYFMDSPVIGDCEMLPVWKIVTNTGDHYINGLTGVSQHLEDFSK